MLCHSLIAEQRINDHYILLAAPATLLLNDRHCIVTWGIVVLQTLEHDSFTRQFIRTFYRSRFTDVVPGIQVAHVIKWLGHVYLQIVERNVSGQFLRTIFFRIGLGSQACLVEGGEIVIYSATILHLVFFHAILREVTHGELFTINERNMDVFTLLVVAYVHLVVMLLCQFFDYDRTIYIYQNTGILRSNHQLLGGSRLFAL